MPHRGHIYQAFNILAYLKCHLNSKLVMNQERMYLGERLNSFFKDDADQFELYGEVKKEISAGDPVPCSNGVEINDWVGVDHAGYMLTCSIHTEVLVFKTFPLIVWY